MAKHVNEAMTSFGLQLAQLRKSAGFTHQELTEECDETYQYVLAFASLIRVDYHL